MNAINFTRLAVLSVAVCALAGATARVQAQLPLAAIAADAAHMDAAQRELGIMRNIFAAAMNEGSQRKGFNGFGFNIGAPEALYLANQGMVFTFHLNGSDRFVYSLGNEFAVPAPPAPPVVNVDGGDFDFDFDYDFDFDFDFGDGGDYSAIREQQREYREQLRTMNEQMRDGQLELRDMQREIRELQREERNDDVDNADRIAEVEARMETLIEEIRNQALSMQQLQQEYQAEQQAAFEAARTEQTAIIFSTLCDYGGTLRSLETGEHVSIVLRNYADNQTQINVFEGQDVMDCTSAETLRQAAVTYVQETRAF